MHPDRPSAGADETKPKTERLHGLLEQLAMFYKQGDEEREAKVLDEKSILQEMTRLGTELKIESYVAAMKAIAVEVGVRLRTEPWEAVTEALKKTGFLDVKKMTALSQEERIRIIIRSATFDIFTDAEKHLNGAGSPKKVLAVAHATGAANGDGEHEEARRFFSSRRKLRRLGRTGHADALPAAADAHKTNGHADAGAEEPAEKSVENPYLEKARRVMREYVDTEEMTNDEQRMARIKKILKITEEADLPHAFLDTFERAKLIKEGDPAYPAILKDVAVLLERILFEDEEAEKPEGPDPIDAIDLEGTIEQFLARLESTFTGHWTQVWKKIQESEFWDRDEIKEWVGEKYAADDLPALQAAACKLCAAFWEFDLYIDEDEATDDVKRERMLQERQRRRTAVKNFHNAVKGLAVTPLAGAAEPEPEPEVPDDSFLNTLDDQFVSPSEQAVWNMAKSAIYRVDRTAYVREWVDANLTLDTSTIDATVHELEKLVAAAEEYDREPRADGALEKMINAVKAFKAISGSLKIALNPKKKSGDPEPAESAAATPAHPPADPDPASHTPPTDPAAHTPATAHGSTPAAHTPKASDSGGVKHSHGVDLAEIKKNAVGKGIMSPSSDTLKKRAEEWKDDASSPEKQMIRILLGQKAYENVAPKPAPVTYVRRADRVAGKSTPAAQAPTKSDHAHEKKDDHSHDKAHINDHGKKDDHGSKDDHHKADDHGKEHKDDHHKKDVHGHDNHGKDKGHGDKKHDPHHPVDDHKHGTENHDKSHPEAKKEHDAHPPAAEAKH